MRSAFWVDAVIFRMIRVGIRSINSVVNFDARSCARLLFLLYLAATINALALSTTLYQALMPLAVLIVSTIPRIERLGRPRASLERDKRSCIFRLLILTVFLTAAALDPILDGSRWIPAHVIWPILLYALDLDSHDKGERRVQLPLVATATHSSKPYSFAFNLESFSRMNASISGALARMRSHCSL
jgi:hypothetical protein